MNSAIAHQRLQAFVLLHMPGGMSIEQPYLSDGGRAHESGVLGLPWRVIGLAAISINEEITFICFFHGRENSSQKEEAPGEGWRRILKATVFSAIRLPRRIFSAGVESGLYPPAQTRTWARR